MNICDVFKHLKKILINNTKEIKIYLGGCNDIIYNGRFST